MTVSSEIGDGPHGRPGRERRLRLLQGHRHAGEAIGANTAGSDFDTVPISGTTRGSWSRSTTTSIPGRPPGDLRSWRPEDGDYFVMVGGFLTLPDDPFDSGSGSGADDEGDTPRIIVAEPPTGTSTPSG